MNINVYHQLLNLFTFTITGIVIGILFDIFRITRRSFNTSDFVTYIEDILFWLLSGILTLYTLAVFNNGEIRFYIFVAILLGIAMYILTISKFIIKSSVFIITFIKKMMEKIIFIITYPIKLLFNVIKKIFLRPITFIYINIRKILSNPVKNIQKTKNRIKNYKKTNKNAIQKKDFNI